MTDSRRYTASSTVDRTPSQAVCAPCLARPLPLPQRVAGLQAAILAEVEPLITLTHLLQLCRDEHSVLWERINDPDCPALLAAVTAPVLDAVAAGPSAGSLPPQLRRALAAALTASASLPAVVAAHTLANLLDERYADSFTESFHRRSPYQPAVGDPMPLDSPHLRQVTTLPATAPPWRLANRLDETRHVRLAGEWATQFRVVFDYTAAQELLGIIGPDTIVATCHPNRTLTELAFPLDARGRTFPVRPIDEDRQKQELDQLIEMAVAAGATIVVLPELCVTQTLAAQLQDWTRRPGGPRLLVAGSYHHNDQHGIAGAVVDGRRRNTAIAFLRGCATPMTQDKHSPADRPVDEDIQPQGWPELRVHVSTDGWHLAMAICRDLLNPHAINALAEAGVNVVLVPAMSETLVAFGGPVAHLVGAGQAFVAVANNPADFPTGKTRRTSATRALFGHPGYPQQSRLVHSVGSGPGVALMQIRTGQLRWLDHQTLPPQPSGPALAQLPRWATDLAALTGADPLPASQQPPQTALRSAAALVLLSDSPEGPCVLLTRRAPDLRNYPGQWVFPGGAADTGDDGPIATALRETSEEAGLNADLVHVLGTLPALVLPESGFVLTPVLAWSPRPLTPIAPVNPAEVSALATVPLRRWSQPTRLDTRTDASGGSPAELLPADVGTATGMVLDMLTGMLGRTGSVRISDALDRVKRCPQ